MSKSEFAAEILADSVNPEGTRLTTMCVTYPRCIHSELMTHRQFSRNSASSRAIPLAKMIENIREHPFVPVHWGRNQKGMQAAEELSAWERQHCEEDWLWLRDQAIDVAERFEAAGLHKQIANRILEPWMWITVIITATEWENFFALRCHPAAEPHIQKIAYMMREQYDDNVPVPKQWGEWHLPLFGNDFDDGPELLLMTGLVVPENSAIKVPHAVKLSAARCARVSYLTHDGKRDVEADLTLHDRLAASGHMSPFEHMAMASQNTGPFSTNWGNLQRGWMQYRKLFPYECIRKRRV